MRKNLIKLLLHLSIVSLLLFIYFLMMEGDKHTEWLIYSFTVVFIILSIVFRKELIVIGRETSFDRFIAIIGIEIALIVYIQTTSQVARNIEESKKNSFKSDSLFNAQIMFTKMLNDSLIIELKNIQDINMNQSLSAENQLKATEKQLELSEQSLVDYIYESRAQLVMGGTEIERTDTVNNDPLYFNISNMLSNNGRRRAKDLDVRQLVVLNDSSIYKFARSVEVDFLDPGTNTKVGHLLSLSKSDARQFYYCIQIIYYDEKYNAPRNDCYYIRYITYSNFTGLLKATNEEKKFLRSKFDEVLKDKGLSLTKN